MRLTFSLRENLDCEKICKAVQKLINDYNKQQLLSADKSLLVIDIVNISQDVDMYIPKIEYKEDSYHSSPT